MIADVSYAITIFNKYFPNVSIYYHPKYISNEKINNFNSEPRFYIYKEENQVFYHAFIENVTKIDGIVYRDIQAPIGYGGPLILGEEDFKERAINNYIEWAKEQDYLVELVKFHPLLKNDNYYGEKLFNRETIVIDLELKELFLSYKSRIRRKIRKAAREQISTTFSKETRYVKAFINIYLELMHSKNANIEYFFTEEYLTKIINEDFVRLVSAVDKEGNILGGVVFLQNDYISDYHLSASNELGRQYAVTSLIIHDYAMYAKMNNLKFLYLGGGYNSEVENTLLHFKQGFSDLVEKFYIGYYVHNKNVYSKLKLDKNLQKEEHRVIFYR